MTQETIIRLKQIRTDALYGKKKHFNAADRKKTYQTALGTSVIIINVLLGSALLALLKTEVPEPMKWIGAGMAAFAAVLTSIQTFFGYQKVIAGHRHVANRYLEVSKQISNTLAGHNDNAIQNIDLLKRLENFTTTMSKINADANAYPTNDDDYRKAKKGIESGEEHYTDRELGAGS
ncbi:MAG: SLATT domain-containing protein [Gallionella sp.]